MVSIIATYTMLSYLNGYKLYIIQVGVIILYDHVHPVGAFAKNAPIDVSCHTCTLVTLGTRFK